MNMRNKIDRAWQSGFLFASLVGVRMRVGAWLLSAGAFVARCIAGMHTAQPRRCTLRGIFATLSTVAMLLFVSTIANNDANATGDIEEGRRKSQSCIACHGAVGISAIPTNPDLAGQVPGYISDALHKFQSGARNNPLMSPMAAPLSEQDIADLDAYYSSLPVATRAVAQSDEAAARAGEKLYRGGEPALSIAACMSCHGPSGHGIPPHFPRIAGQHKEYLKAQLLALKSGERQSDIMNPIAFLLSLQQIEELSAYMQGLR